MQNILYTRMYLPTLLMIFLSITVWGCSSSTAVHLQDHSMVKGHLIYGDKEAVYVEHTEGAAPKKILRETISKIDHPGSDMQVAGGVLLGVGVIASILPLVLMDDCDTSYFSGICVMTKGLVMIPGLISTGVGGGLISFGVRLEASSVKASMLPSEPRAGDLQSTMNGTVSVSWTW